MRRGRSRTRPLFEADAHRVFGPRRGLRPAVFVGAVVVALASLAILAVPRRTTVKPEATTPTVEPKPQLIPA